MHLVTGHRFFKKQQSNLGTSKTIDEPRPYQRFPNRTRNHEEWGMATG